MIPWEDSHTNYMVHLEIMNIIYCYSVRTFDDYIYSNYVHSPGGYYYNVRQGIFVKCVIVV